MNTRKQCNVIFVGGIHGVGKSSFTKKLAIALSADSYTASELIKEARDGITTWGSDKRATDIDDNQELLSVALNELRDQRRPIILDGHFVLRDSDGEFEKIPVSVFEELKPSILLVLKTEPRIILKRLRERDSSNISLEEIEKFQSAEIEHANNIGTALKIPLIKASNPEAKTLADQITQLL